MNLLRPLSDITVADKQELSSHLWIRKYAISRRDACSKANKYSEQIAWDAVAQHEANAVADMLVQQ